MYIYYVYIYIYTYICTYVYIQICICVYINLYVYIKFTTHASIRKKIYEVATHSSHSNTRINSQDIRVAEVCERISRSLV